MLRQSQDRDMKNMSRESLNFSRQGTRLETPSWLQSWPITHVLSSAQLNELRVKDDSVGQWTNISDRHDLHSSRVQSSYTAVYALCTSTVQHTKCIPSLCNESSAMKISK